MGAESMLGSAMPYTALVGGALGLGRTLFGPGGIFGKKQDFGEDIAKDNMQRYGFQGVYQQYLTGEHQRLKDQESNRILRLATNLVPAEASLRNNIMKQGMSMQASNVIGKEQRDSMQAKALDTGFGAQEQMSSRLDQSLMGMTQANEQMRFGASQDYMKTKQMQAGSENEAWDNLGNFGNQMMNAGIGYMNRPKDSNTTVQPIASNATSNSSVGPSPNYTPWSGLPQQENISQQPWNMSVVNPTSTRLSNLMNPNMQSPLNNSNRFSLLFGR